MSLPIIIHEAAECMPRCSAAEYKALTADIKDRGIEEQIRYIEKNGEAHVYDGRTRIGVLKELKIDPWSAKTVSGQPVMQKVKVPPDKTEIEFVCESVRSLNVNRRHNNKSQLATAGAKLLKLLNEEALQIAEAEREMQNLETLKKADPELLKKVEAGDVTLKAAMKKIDKDDSPKRAKAREGTGEKVKGEKGATLRGKAAKAVGASPRNVGTAQLLQKENPKLFRKVEDGEMTLNAALKEHKHLQQENKLSKAAAKAEAESVPVLQEILLGDCVKRLPELKKAPNLIFADPPYNYGINYGGGFKDDLSEDEYYEWCGKWMTAAYDALDKFGSAVIVSAPEHGAQFDLGLREIGFHIRARLILKENFGTYVKGNFGKCHRVAFYCVKDRKKFTFNEEPFLVQSTRQEMGDKRADPRGKIMGDVIDYTRVCGTFKERIESFPTQLSLAFVQMFVNGLSMPNDLVCDPFCGSGTTAEACLRGDRGQRKFIGWDINEKFVIMADQRLKVARTKLLKSAA